ncbi:MAG: hypothetical protein PHZ19_03535 [Candidatus Thermoplasmatota archaeon]|nr:hypothetical protein [Candidatus Thermoplasmatota archaeon]
MDVPTNWGPGIDYGRFYIVQESRIFSGHTDAQTTTSSLAGYGSEDILSKVYFATINIVTGTTSFPNDVSFFSYIPWIGLIALPLSFLAYARRLERTSDKKIGYSCYLIIFIVAAFPLASLTNNYGSPNGTLLGRFFTLLLFIILFDMSLSPQLNYKKITSFFVLASTLFLTYHTWSYYFILILVSFFLYSILSKNKPVFLTSCSTFVTFFLLAAIFNKKQL